MKLRHMRRSSGTGKRSFNIQQSVLNDWNGARGLSQNSRSVCQGLKQVWWSCRLLRAMRRQLQESGTQPITVAQANPERSNGRIHNTRKLLTAAALIMSFLLLASSIVTTMLIPAEEFRPETDLQEAGAANGRALAYLAHHYLGDVFGTVYDLSTISILWFAGSSALGGFAQHRSALFAALRNGAGMGSSDTSARCCIHSHLFFGDNAV